MGMPRRRSRPHGTWTLHPADRTPVCAIPAPPDLLRDARHDGGRQVVADAGGPERTAARSAATPGRRIDLRRHPWWLRRAVVLVETQRDPRYAGGEHTDR